MNHSLPELEKVSAQDILEVEKDALRTVAEWVGQINDQSANPTIDAQTLAII